MKYTCIILMLFLISGCAANQQSATSDAEMYQADITIDGTSIPVTLSLNADKTAQMDREGAMTGTWERGSGGYLTVTLADKSGATINEVYVFIEETGSVTVLEHRVDGMALGSRSERFTLQKK